MLLDFSKKEIWMEAAWLAIEKVIPKEVISLAQQEDQETMFDDDLYYIIKHFSSLEPWISIDELGDDFDRCICYHYKKIKGFHACRISNEDSYKRHGLREKTKDFILELAIERFSAFTTREEIKQACRELEICENDSGVYFFPALNNAMDSSQNHYLKCGSEILQGLSHTLGLNNQGILSNQGDSCIIECNIPIKEIKLGFRISIWKVLITRIFREKAGKVFNESVPDIGYTTYKKVEPECIQKFHYIKDSSYTYTLNLH